jgi:DNA-directed RNA polymerase subunit E'/Rpb7
METRAIFERKITLTPRDLNKVSKTRPIDSLILEKVQNELEGKCSQHGWVIPQSIKLLSRSLCHCEAGRFTGAMTSWVQAEGGVYYPVDGMELEAEVLKKNKMGMFVVFNDAIQVMVPRDLHIENEEYHDVGIGDKIRVEIKKSRFQVNDQYILSVGVFKGVVEKAAVVEAVEEPIVPLAAPPVVEAAPVVAANEMTEEERQALAALNEEEEYDEDDNNNDEEGDDDDSNGENFSGDENANSNGSNYNEENNENENA